MKLDKPLIIAIGGLSGSGKTTLSQGLTEFFNDVSLDNMSVCSDLVRKKLWADTHEEAYEPHKTLPDEAYDDHFGTRTYDSLIAQIKDNIDQPRVVLVEATFMSADMRDDIESIANDNGASFLGIWLEASADTLIDRVEDRQNCPDNISDADSECVRSQLKSNIGENNWLKINSEKEIQRTLYNVIGMM